MKRLSKRTERWAIGSLGVVCLVLVVSLAWKIFNTSVPPINAAQSAASPDLPPGPRRPAASRPAARDELAKYDPTLNLALLKQIESQPLPESSRNPFEYPPPPAPPVEKTRVQTPVAPPPPPPPPIKAIGYSLKAGNVAEAVVADEEEIYVVHVGDTFGKRYHVLAISPDRVDIEDSQTQQTVHLPIAQ